MRDWSRRDFLTTSAIAGTGLLRTAAFAQDYARNPVGAASNISANEKVVLGIIGVGGMGTGLLNIFKGFADVDIAAVCDVYEANALKAQAALNGKPKVYGDFRQVLDRKDINAVVVATPDHWHAIPTIMACQAEKDVYCEKPLAHRVQEGRAMVEASRKHKRVTQMGNLIHATDNYHRVVEIVRSGALGQITKTRVWMAADRSGLGRPADTAPPEGLDYNFWLGPAPQRPFNPNRFIFNWRYFWDYGGGILTDFCCHLVDLVHWGMGVDAPKTISATGGRYALQDNCEVPDTMEVVYEYEKDGKPFQMIWSQTDASNFGFEGLKQGILFQGTDASLIATYRDYKIINEKGKTLVEPPVSLPRSVSHHREWIDAIRTRDQCSCHFEYGHRLASVGNLGNISLWTGEKLKWDAAAEKVTNHPEANQYLTKEYRKPWTLPTV